VEPDFLVATLGKALGSSGAFVVGPPELKALMLSAARPFVYTTAVPEGVAAAAMVALRLADSERRERLSHNARLLRLWLGQAGIAVLGAAHILPVLAGSDAMALAEALLEEGIFAPGIRYPTVPRGQERVRLTVSAAHTEAELAACVEAFGRALRRLRQ
jgi:7-keto-8-aminopelargonate synthetase-like enzyme